MTKYGCHSWKNPQSLTLYVCVLPIVWTLVDLSPVVWLLLHWFEGLGVRGLLFHLDHIWGAGLGSRRKATQCGQCRGTIWIQTFGLQLRLCQEHLPSLHLLLQLVIVRLVKRQKITLSEYRQHSVLAMWLAHRC